MHRKLVVLVCLLGALLRGPAWAEGYLATDLQKLPDLVFGVDQAGFAVSTPSYRLTTGKAYQLTIVSARKREYAIHAVVPIKPGKYRIYAKGLDSKGAVSNIEVK